jgi:predicted ATP-grasp superfamily ATP-dependent carboligase
VTPSHPPTVLALGSGVTLLGVVRTLGGQGMSVIALPDADRITRRSRWYHPAPQEFAGLKPNDLPRALSSLHDSVVLMPCSDLWARTVSALPDDLRRRFPSSTAPVAALDILVDKARFGESLDRLGLPHPTTRFVRRLADLDGVRESAFESSFLKPVHSQQFFARFGVKAFRITGKSDARNRLQQCFSEGLDMMLQEYIPGPPTNHYFIDGFVDRHGEIKALFARQRLRMSPPDFGNSTLMVSIPLADVSSTVTTLKSLFTDISYRGIFSAEFKLDDRDETFNLIEVNARPWWYVEFAARCGVDVCTMAVRDALGEPVERVLDYITGRRCVFPYYDLHAARAARSAGKLTLAEWTRSWLGAYQPIFRWSDPWPAFGEVGALAKQRLRKLGKRAH